MSRGGPDRYGHGPRWCRSNDEGVATLWVAGAIGVVFVVVLGAVWLAAATVARHRAGSAADLGALAAASHVRAGSRAACARAAWVADRMRVELGRCTVQGWDTLIEVTARPAGTLGRFGVASARARAGPVPP